MHKPLTAAALIGAIGLIAVTAQADDFGGRGPFGAALGLDFATLDANGDGLLTPDEITAAGAARFATADLNADGALSADEMIAAAEAARAAARQAMVAEVTARMDANGDGLLQLDEIADELPDPGRLVNRVDQDGDGAISAAEFAEMGEGRRHGGGHGPRGWGFGLFNG